MPKIDWGNVQEWDDSRPSTYKRSDFSYVMHEGEGKEDGNGRNTYCYHFACSLRAQDVPEAEAWQQLMQFNQTHCIPPLPEGELRGRLKSAYSLPAGHSAGYRAGKVHSASSGNVHAPGKPGEAKQQPRRVLAAPVPKDGAAAWSNPPMYMPSMDGFREVDFRLCLAPDAVKLPEVPPMQPAQQLQAMVKAMFHDWDHANIVLATNRDGHPYGGGFMVDATITEAGAADFLAHVNKAHGAFIRINPTSGRHEERGAKAEGDADVTAFRHLLIEYDPPHAGDMTPEELEAAKTEWLKRVLALKLPIAAIVDSGNKSIHAIVTITDPEEEAMPEDSEDDDRPEDAETEDKDKPEDLVQPHVQPHKPPSRDIWNEHRDFVYRVLRANGIPFDASCKNPSRLCRLAGAERNGHMQKLIATGEMLEGICHSWAEWKRYIYDRCQYGHLMIVDPSGREHTNPDFHIWIARRLLYGLGACRVEGAPAVLDLEGHWHAGWDAVERGIFTFWPQAKDNLRREVLKNLNLTIPDRRPAPPEVVAFSNGFLNMRTMEFSSTCSAPILNTVPCEWHPGATSDAVENMLNAASDGSAATRANIEEMLGHVLFRNSSTYQYIWVLLGHGSNGKSTLLDAVKDVLGPENISGILPEDLKGNFARADLIGKLAMIADDPASGSMSEETKAQLKKVSGGNLVDSDVKNRPRVSFTPYCTCILSYNSFPHIPNPEYGFMRRLVVIPFTHTFRPGDEGYDPHIREHLATEEARQALLVHAVKGFRRLDLCGCPTPNPIGEAMKAEVETNSDSVLAWRDAEGITAEHDLCNKAAPDVFREYSEWCDSNGYAAYNSATFGKRIRRYFSVKTVPLKTSSGKSLRTYVSDGTA